jgi:hypothetical protein
LGGSPNRALSLPRAAPAGICALAASRPQTHIAIIDPADGSVRTGAAIWKRVRELRAELALFLAAVHSSVGISNA